MTFFWLQNLKFRFYFSSSSSAAIHWQRFESRRRLFAPLDHLPRFSLDTGLGLGPRRIVKRICVFNQKHWKTKFLRKKTRKQLFLRSMSFLQIWNKKNWKCQNETKMMARNDSLEWFICLCAALLCCKLNEAKWSEVVVPDA